MLNKFRADHIPTILAFAGALGLSVESYLSLSNRSLCATAACQTVGKYLTISESLVVAAGAAFFWILALILFLATRNPERLKNWPLYLLAIALAVDSSLIGFQFFSIQQKCLLCISVAVFLVLIAVAYCLTRKLLVTLTCFFLIWIGGFFVHKIMIMPAPQGAFSNMVFLSLQNETPIQSDAPPATLIFSMNCPHCLDVVHYLSENPLDRNLKLASIDSDEESLAKISSFLKEVPQSSNPFILLGEIKEKSTPSAGASFKTDGLKVQTKNALNFLSNLGITSIPVLIVEQSTHEKKILIGSSEIIEYLSRKK